MSKHNCFSLFELSKYTDPREFMSDSSDLEEKYAIFSYHTWKQRWRYDCSNKTQLQNTTRI